jgi:hypothetical protein
MALISALHPSFLAEVWSGSWLCKNDLSEVILAVWFLRDFAEGSG